MNPRPWRRPFAGAIHSLDKNIPLSEIQTMDQVVAEATGQSRFYLILLGAFATWRWFWREWGSTAS